METHNNRTIWKPTSGFFKFENKGDEIEGIFWGSKKTNINGKDATIHILETEDKIVNVFGNTVLNDKIKFVPIGRKIKIILKEQNDNKNYKDYFLYWG